MSALCLLACSNLHECTEGCTWTVAALQVGELAWQHLLETSGKLCPEQQGIEGTAARCRVSSPRLHYHIFADSRSKIWQSGPGLLHGVLGPLHLQSLKNDRFAASVQQPGWQLLQHGQALGEAAAAGVWRENVRV